MKQGMCVSCGAGGAVGARPPAAAGPPCSQGEVFVRNRAGGGGCQRKPM